MRFNARVRTRFDIVYILCTYSNGMFVPLGRDVTELIFFRENVGPASSALGLQDWEQTGVHSVL